MIFLPLYAALYVRMTFKLVRLVHEVLNNTKGKKKCLATISKKKQDERSTKNLTLFSFLQRKDKGEPLSAAEAAQDTEVGMPRAHLVSLSTLYP